MMDKQYVWIPPYLYFSWGFSTAQWNLRSWLLLQKMLISNVTGKMQKKKNVNIIFVAQIFEWTFFVIKHSKVFKKNK